MFNFFKRKGGKGEATGTADRDRNKPSADSKNTTPVDARAPRNDNDVTNDSQTNTPRKDVVNLLITETDYSQKTGVGAFLQIMAGKRKKGKKTVRSESARVSPQKEMKSASLQRSKSEREAKRDDDVPAKNTQESARAHTPPDPADFVRALVLQKYANKSPEPKHQHVSTVYVSPDLDEKRHAEALLREIARSIDCTIEKIIENKEPMGANDSKAKEPQYETIEESRKSPIDSYKTEVKSELDKLIQSDKSKEDNNNEKECNVNTEVKKETVSIESPGLLKKSNLKPPRSDTEGCSDDDRSECSKKRVTFRKHIVFDDGDQQTDEEINSSFESLTSEEEEEEEYLEDALPDNDELLGGYVVSRDKSVVNITEITDEDDGLKRISSDNSDSGFVDDKQFEIETSDVKTIVEEYETESEVSEEESGETETETETEEEIVEVIEIEENAEPVIIEPSDPRHVDNKKSLVSQESRFQSQVAALTELADSRCGEAEKTRELIASYRKEIEAKDHEIQQLKCDLAAAYKESELVRQRSRSLEEELCAARSCSADLADQLKKRNDDSIRQLRAELEDALTHRAELESRVLALERDRDRLEREKSIQEQKAQEALAAAEANTAKWRAAHEAARSQAAARAERMLADCEWKMRELERRARDAEKQNKELTSTVDQLRNHPEPSSTHLAELSQLRGLVSEQQRSVQALTLQLQRAETREEGLKLEVHRLKDLLDKETRIGKEKEERHMKTIERLEQTHSKALETFKAETAAHAASTRATLERAHAERTRAALQQLRQESDQRAKNDERKLREVTARFENLKEVLASKETQFEQAIAEAHSKADWDIMQLRHMLDKADITYANNIERMNERFEKEKETLIEEWTEKVKTIEEQSATAAEEARKLLESTRTKLISEKNEQLTKLKDKHKQEMDEQWEQFMIDKEYCLARMKTECRQEGEEERVKREKELLEEIAELKALLQSKSVDYETLTVKAAACGRTLAVTEQELREALAREKELREKRAEDATKIKQAERASKDQVEHLTRKCACLRKLFDDIRAKLVSRERAAADESRAKDKEIRDLKAEVARLTKLLFAESTPDLGARTRADGCETTTPTDEKGGFAHTPTPRRKGGSLKLPDSVRRRPNMSDLTPLPPEARRPGYEVESARKRSKSVDLPAVQVPCRIKQLEERTKEQ